MMAYKNSAKRRRFGSFCKVLLRHEMPGCFYNQNIGAGEVLLRERL